MIDVVFVDAVLIVLGTGDCEFIKCIGKKRRPLPFPPASQSIWERSLWVFALSASYHLVRSWGLGTHHEQVGSKRCLLRYRWGEKVYSYDQTDIRKTPPKVEID